jgi:hypothetical protein
MTVIHFSRSLDNPTLAEFPWLTLINCQPLGGEPLLPLPTDQILTFCGSARALLLPSIRVETSSTLSGEVVPCAAGASQHCVRDIVASTSCRTGPPGSWRARSLPAERYEPQIAYAVIEADPLPATVTSAVPTQPVPAVFGVEAETAALTLLP